MGALGWVEKEPFDVFPIRNNYQDVLWDSETLTSVALHAETLAGVDVTSTLLASATADLVTGTATGGSTSTLIDTAKNFKTAGVQIGDRFYNSTKKWMATVTEITTTTNAFDTLHFSVQASAAAASDAYKFLFAKGTVQAGTDATIYKIRFQATTSESRKFEDVLELRVIDH